MKHKKTRAQFFQRTELNKVVLGFIEFLYGFANTFVQLFWTRPRKGCVVSVVGFEQKTKQTDKEVKQNKKNTYIENTKVEVEIEI